MSSKWYITLIAIVALIFSSGCSLVVIKGMEDELGKLDKELAKDEKADEEKKKEDEDEPDAEPPANEDDEADPARNDNSGQDQMELTASNLTFFADDQGWAEESFMDFEEEVEITQFTPGGQDPEYVTEVIQVQAYPGMQNFITTLVVAEGTRESLEEEYGGNIRWNVLDQDRDHMLVEMGMSEEGDEVNGLARFLSNDYGIYAVVYITRDDWSLDKREKWQDLLNQAGDNDDLTL